MGRIFFCDSLFKRNKTIIGDEKMLFTIMGSKVELVKTKLITFKHFKNRSAFEEGDTVYLVELEEQYVWLTSAKLDLEFKHLLFPTGSIKSSNRWKKKSKIDQS